MSKLMWIVGILLIAAGIALGVLLAVSPATVTPFGIASVTPAMLLVIGGIICLGQGSIIGLLQKQHALLLEGMGIAEAARPASIPEFGRKAGETAAAAAAASAAAAKAAPGMAEEVSEPTRDTINALEQARQKIEQAFEPKPASETPVAQEEPEAAEEPEEEPDVVPGQLYVVEERFIRMRPARILSDGTVEAETSEGWMRFENLEHLDEYLDAMEPAKG